MKEGWEYKKLKDVATFTRGLTYSKNDEVEVSNNIVLRSNNVDLSTGKLNFDELKYLRPEFSVPEEKRVKKGSLLMCMSNGSKIHLGKVALINEDYPYAFGGFMALVTPNEKLNPQFFHYSLSSPEYKDFIKQLSAGANINNIKVKELELFTIPVPPLSEQQRIVDYLDAAFAKIDAMKANAEKSLNEAKALFQASLKEILEPKEGWEFKKLGEVCGKCSNIKWDDVSNEASYRYIDLTSVDRGDLHIHNPQNIRKDNAPSRAKQIIKAGDVIFATTRPTLRRVSIIEEQYDGDICSTGFCVLRHNEVVKSRFVFYALLYDGFYKYIEPLQTGANYPAVTDNVVKNYIIPVPPLSEQQTIVATLDSLKSKVDRLQANFEKISQECDALKQAILRQVFE